LPVAAETFGIAGLDRRKPVTPRNGFLDRRVDEEIAGLRGIRYDLITERIRNEMGFLAPPTGECRWRPGLAPGTGARCRRSLTLVNDITN
jgi:hypothetical protein